MHELRALAITVAILSLAIGVGLGFRKSNHEAKLAAQERYVRVLAYDGFLSGELLAGFKQQMNVSVLLDTVINPQQMQFHLKENPDDYDVILPYLSQIDGLRKAQRLLPLAVTQMPNLDNIHIDFQRDPQAPGQVVFAAMAWGINGLLINKTKLDPVPTSLRDVFARKTLRKKVSWLKEPGEVRHLLERRRMLEESFEDSDNGLVELRSALTELMSFVDFQSELPLERLRSGQYWVAEASNGRAAYAMQTQDNLAFVLPEEGSSLWMMGAVIPAKTAHLKWAQAFVNYTLDASRARQIVETSHQATTYKGSWTGLPELAKASYLKSIPLGLVAINDGNVPGAFRSGEIEKWLTSLK